jgi:hypothetical protein
LTNHQLDLISSSEDLQVGSEDQLFKIITQLIELDNNRKVLLKSIKIPFVSVSLFNEFFEDFALEELDLELFDLLKERLNFEQSNTNISSISKRWKTSPKFLPQQEIEELFEISN